MSDIGPSCHEYNCELGQPLGLLASLFSTMMGTVTVCVAVDVDIAITVVMNLLIYKKSLGEQ